MFPKTQFGMDVEEQNLGLNAIYELLKREKNKTFNFLQIQTHRPKKKTGQNPLDYFTCFQMTDLPALLALPEEKTFFAKTFVLFCCGNVIRDSTFSTKLNSSMKSTFKRVLKPASWFYSVLFSPLHHRTVCPRSTRGRQRPSKAKSPLHPTRLDKWKKEQFVPRREILDADLRVFLQVLQQ